MYCTSRSRQQPCRLPADGRYVAVFLYFFMCSLLLIISDRYPLVRMVVRRYRYQCVRSIICRERERLVLHTIHRAIKCVRGTEAEENPESQNSTKALFSMLYPLFECSCTFRILFPFVHFIISQLKRLIFSSAFNLLQR